MTLILTRCVPTPEAAIGGPLALVENGDVITINTVDKSIELEVSTEQLEARRAAWVEPGLKPLYKRGVLAQYRTLVSQAHLGAVLG